MQDLARKHMTRWTQMKSKRQPFEAEWEKLIKLFHPYKDSFATNTRGGRGREPQLDSTAREAAENFLSFLKSQLLSSVDTSWFKLTPPVEYKDELSVIKALDITSERVMQEIEGTVFHSKITAALWDLIIIGNSVLRVEEAPPLSDGSFGGFIIENIPMANCWWHLGVNDEIVYFAVLHEMSAIDAVEEFPNDLELKEVMKENELADVKYLQFLYRNPSPNEAQDSETPAEEKVWRSDWINLANSEQIVRESGYDDIPYIKSRWRVLDNRQYGDGRAAMARADAAGASVIRGKQMTAVAWDLDPPVFMDQDSAINLRVTPGGTSILRAGARDPRTLLKGSNYAASNLILEQDREAIKKCFMADAFTNPATQPRSAEESRIIESKANLALSAPAENVGSELLKPFVQRAVRVMHGAEQLPEFNEVLNEMGPLIIGHKFTAPFFLAQQAATVRSMVETLQLKLELFRETEDHRYIDDIDPDKVSAVLQRSTGSPSEIFLAKELVAKLRTARADQATLNQSVELQKALGSEVQQPQEVGAA